MHDAVLIAIISTVPLTLGSLATLVVALGNRKRGIAGHAATQEELKALARENTEDHASVRAAIGTVAADQAAMLLLLQEHAADKRAHAA